jgi:hypothetical protein
MGPKLITYGQLVKWLGMWDSLAMKFHLGYKFLVTSIRNKRERGMENIPTPQI